MCRGYLCKCRDCMDCDRSQNCIQRCKRMNSIPCNLHSTNRFGLLIQCIVHSRRNKYCRYWHILQYRNYLQHKKYKIHILQRKRRILPSTGNRQHCLPRILRKPHHLKRTRSLLRHPWRHPRPSLQGLQYRRHHHNDERLDRNSECHLLEVVGRVIARPDCDCYNRQKLFCS